MDESIKSALYFVLMCVGILVVIVPLLYAIAKCYMDKRCCFVRKRSEYDTFDDASLSIEILEDEKLEIVKENESYVLEKGGFFYLRSTLAGSTYTLLGKSRSSLNSLDSLNNNSKDIATTINISIGYSQSKRSIWLMFDAIRVSKGLEIVDNGLNFKLKSKVSDSVGSEDYVCRMNSRFMTQNEVLKHLFYFNNAKKDMLNQQTLKITLYAKETGNNHKLGKFHRQHKLGETLIDLKDLDSNGNTLKLSRQFSTSGNSILF